MGQCADMPIGEEADAGEKAGKRNEPINKTERINRIINH